MKIESYDPLNAQLTQLKELAAFIPDTSTKEGYNKSRRLSLDIKKVKSNLEKARKKEKEHYLEGGRQVDSQAKTIKAALELAQAPHLEAYQAVDNKEKLAKELRMNECQSNIDAMTSLLDKAEFATSSEVAGFIQTVDGVDTDEGFYELTLEAFQAKTRVLKNLASMYESKQKAEAEAIELAELRKLKAESDQREHDERIKREAKEQAEAETRAASEREEQAKRDQLEAEKAQFESEKRAVELEKQNKINIENAKIESDKQEAELVKQNKINIENARLQAIETEKQNKLNIENARIQAEKDRVAAAEQARLNEIARQEQEAETERLRVEKLEADKAHVGNIRKQIKEDLMKFAGLDEETAKKVTMALSKKQIRNTKVNY